MKLAILGATGMLGHHSTRAALAAGHEVLVLHRKSSSLERLHKLPVRFRQVDTEVESSLADSLHDVDCLIHCAAYYPVRPRAWQEDVREALDRDRRLYEAARKCELSKVVYVGGSIALPRHPQGKPGDESLNYLEPPASKNAYLQVKYALDKMALDYAAMGLPVSTAIPGLTFGEFDYGPTTGQLITRIANDELPGYVTGKRNVIYAGDAGRGIIRVAEDGRPGQRYLLTGENLTMTELVNNIASICNKRAPRKIPLIAARAVGAAQLFRYHFLRGELPGISETAIAIMASGQFLSGKKAQEELGFVAEVPICEALQRAYGWFREEGYI